ncbi:hypothetical protein PROFUN_16089 [Planoprotostelium fungivorum]|uniref:Uncharacterized protein n=1 Tax=Planoprotostelium fungivorum TaxID=1890364 RepID=A0A2P6MT86_9EUKA|nr:hypothetical protein PROFUN_16089 [Planoprotostelium fungivorum]
MSEKRATYRPLADSTRINLTRRYQPEFCGGAKLASDRYTLRNNQKNENAKRLQHQPEHELKMEEILGWELLRHILFVIFRRLDDQNAERKHLAIRTFGVCQQVSHRWREECQRWFDLDLLDYRPFWGTYKRCTHASQRSILNDSRHLPFRLRQHSTGNPEQDHFLLHLLPMIVATCPDILNAPSEANFFANIIIRREDVELLRQLLSSTSPLFPLSSWINLAASAGSEKVLSLLLSGDYDLSSVAFPENTNAMIESLGPDTHLRRRLVRSDIQRTFDPSWFLAAVSVGDEELVRCFAGLTDAKKIVDITRLILQPHDEDKTKITVTPHNTVYYLRRDIAWEDLMRWGCAEPMIRGEYDGDGATQLLSEAIMMNRADLVQIILQRGQTYTREETVKVVERAIRTASMDIVEMLCRSTQIDRSIDREIFIEAMKQRNPDHLKLLDSGLIVPWPEDAPRMDEMIGWDVTKKIISFVMAEFLTDYHHRITSRVKFTYKSYRMVARSWAVECEKLFLSGLSDFDGEPVWKTFERCQYPVQREFLSRILHRPGIRHPNTLNLRMMDLYQRSPSTKERDEFIIHYLSESMQGLQRFFAGAIIRAEDTGLLQGALLSPRLNSISVNHWLSFAVNSLKLSTFLADLYPQYSDQHFHIANWDRTHSNILHMLTKKHPKYELRASIHLAGFGDPSCFEFVNRRDSKHMTSVITTAILSNARYSNPEMQEKLLSPEISSMCHSFYHLLIAGRGQFTELVNRIKSHLKLTVDDLSIIVSPPDAPPFSVDANRNMGLIGSLSLLDIVEYGCIDLLSPIIEGEIENTRFNDSILHAVVRSGRCDLLQSMDRRMWFSSGTKNEAVLEAIRAGNEEMVQMLCDSEKIDFSVNEREIQQAAIESKLPRVIEMCEFAAQNSRYNNREVLDMAKQGDPHCFELVDRRDVRWMTKVVATAVTTNVKGMKLDMREKLLSAEMLPLCHSFQILIVAIQSKFRGLAEHIAPHLKMTTELLADLFDPVQQWRRVQFDDGSSLMLTESISLLDFAECGVIELLRPVIQEGARTTFNDSILHAVVRSGNIDLLQLMEEKMWFSSGQKNEALLEAMRESKEEMMEILCRSEKIDRSINPEEIEAARMASESQRILEFFTYIM